MRHGGLDTSTHAVAGGLRRQRLDGCSDRPLGHGCTEEWDIHALGNGERGSEDGWTDGDDLSGWKPRGECLRGDLRADAARISDRDGNARRGHPQSRTSM